MYHRFDLFHHTINNYITDNVTQMNSAEMKRRQSAPKVHTNLHCAPTTLRSVFIMTTLIPYALYTFRHYICSIKPPTRLSPDSTLTFSHSPVRHHFLLSHSLPHPRLIPSTTLFRHLPPKPIRLSLPR